MLATGAPAAWDLALSAADKGAVIQFFAPAKPGQQAAFDINALFFNEFEIQASYSAGPRDTRAALDADRRAARSRPTPLITHRFPLEHTAAGARHGAQPRGHQGDRDRLVRAALLHAPGDLRIEDVPDPVAGPGEVVLAIGAAASCGTDVKSVKRGHPSLARLPVPPRATSSPARSKRSGRA